MTEEIIELSYKKPVKKCKFMSGDRVRFSGEMKGSVIGLCDCNPWCGCYRVTHITHNQMLVNTGIALVAELDMVKL